MRPFFTQPRQSGSRATSSSNFATQQQNAFPILCLPDELLEKVLDNFVGQELGHQISLTCRRFRRIAAGLIHLKWAHSMTDMQIERIWHDWDQSSMSAIRICRRSQRILPLPTGPLPRNVVGVGSIEVRFIDNNVYNFFHTLLPLLTTHQIKYNLILTTQNQWNWICTFLNLFGGCSTTQQQLNLLNLKFVLPTDYCTIRHANWMSIHELGGDDIELVTKWLHDPLADGKPRILSIKEVQGHSLFQDLVGRLEREFFCSLNGIKFAIVINSFAGNNGHPEEFRRDNCRTGESLLLQHINNTYKISRVPNASFELSTDYVQTANFVKFYI